MLLAVDYGNFKVSYGLFKDDVLPSSRTSIPRSQLPEDSSQQIQMGLSRMGDCGAISGAVIACVVPDALEQFVLALGQIAPDVVVLDSETPVGMKISYLPPSALGPDRLANALAIRQLYGGPSCVVDMGTATNFDVVGSDGSFAGGAIAPGLTASSECLWKRAARLSNPGLSPPAKALGQSTAECLQSGLVLGYAGMIDHMVGLLQQEAGAFRRVIGTGGDVALVAHTTKAIQEVRPTLTLEGLNAAYRIVRG